MRNITIAFFAILASLAFASASNGALPNQTIASIAETERAAEPEKGQLLARLCPFLQYYQEPYIEAVWGYIPNVGYRVVDLIYHGGSCNAYPYH